MVIDAYTDMLLSRYSNFGKHAFLPSLMDVLKEHGYVWMLKAGKRSSPARLNEILDSGGWIVLRAPKADGGKSYISRFSAFSEEKPDDDHYPDYHNDIVCGESEVSYDVSPTYQWFKLDFISELAEGTADALVVSKTGKSVNEVIATTRTAVMFIRNSKTITIKEANA